MSDQPEDRYGLIGFPVKHSFSALMHNAAFAHYGIRASYGLFEISPADLGDFFEKRVKQLGLKGFNITVPHKETACSFLSGSVSEGVRLTAAVNTIRVEPDGTLTGFNTDGPGFARDLEERGIGIAGKKVVLFGAGGAAKSVARTLARGQAKQIILFDSDQEKSRRLVGLIKDYYPNVLIRCVGSVSDLDVGSADILVNATPVGMKLEDPLLIDPSLLHKDLFVYDLIYNPAQTRLLTAAREKGCVCANGLGMLLHQGCLAFSLWTGQDVTADLQDVMKKALEESSHA